MYLYIIWELLCDIQDYKWGDLKVLKRLNATKVDAVGIEMYPCEGHVICLFQNQTLRMKIFNLRKKKKKSNIRTLNGPAVSSKWSHYTDERPTRNSLR